jgi:uncharacterized phage protein (TIGR01671 family)
MREIKFRGLDIDTKKWVFGGYHKIDDNTTIIINHHYNNLARNTQVIPESVGQFTGLTDKNGVDIYEGDILTNKLEKRRRNWEKGHDYYVVQYSNGGYLTEAYNGNFIVKPSLNNKNSILEVIGNIHENKELIT